MTIDKKISLIKENRDVAVAALDSYLDYIYELQDSFLDENGDLKKDLANDNKAEYVIKSSKENCNKYENVRKKLNKNDFELSFIEIDYIILAFQFTSIKLEKQLNNIIKAQELCNSILKNLKS